MKEFKSGETFKVKGRTYKAFLANSGETCKDCGFCGTIMNDTCDRLACSIGERTDKKPVIFKEVR